MGNKTTKFGSLLVYDAYGCNPETLCSQEICEEILYELAKITGMTPISEPIIRECDGNLVLGGKDPGGYSGLLLIQESHISIHTFHKRKFVTIDLYSCTKFDRSNVIEYLDNKFEPDDSDVLQIDRGLKYPTENLL